MSFGRKFLTPRHPPHPSPRQVGQCGRRLAGGNRAPLNRASLPRRNPSRAAARADPEPGADRQKHVGRLTGGGRRLGCRDGRPRSLHVPDPSRELHSQHRLRFSFRQTTTKPPHSFCRLKSYREVLARVQQTPARAHKHPGAGNQG